MPVQFRPPAPERLIVGRRARSRRLLEGADIYQLAKNCRTSVEMIEKHYAVHIKDMLDASAINVRKSKSRATRTKANSDPVAAKPTRTPSSRLAKRR